MSFPSLFRPKQNQAAPKKPQLKVLLYGGLCLMAQTASAFDLPENPAWLRHADGLLERPDLQKIVEIQNQRDADGLQPYFGRKDPLVRARAAFAAGSVQDASLLANLTKLLNDPDPRVRVDAAFALRQTAANPLPKEQHRSPRKNLRYNRSNPRISREKRPRIQTVAPGPGTRGQGPRTRIST